MKSYEFWRALIVPNENADKDSIAFKIDYVYVCTLPLLSEQQAITYATGLHHQYGVQIKYRVAGSDSWSNYP